MRLIDADALHIDFDRYVEHIRLMKKGRIPKTEIAILLDCKGAIDNAPTVDAVPVRHGKWIEGKAKNIKTGEVRLVRKCSECESGYFIYDFLNSVDEIPSYCPNCGAKMDEEKAE